MAHHGGRGGEEKSRQSMISSAAEFCYLGAADIFPGQTHLMMTHLQSFESNQEMYGLASSMDMIGFQPKVTLLHAQGSDQPHLMVAAETPVAWQENTSRLLVDESSLRCVFPCEGISKRPSQELSLNLSSTNASTIVLQSFELRQTSTHSQSPHSQVPQSGFRFISADTISDGYVGKPSSPNFQPVIVQDGFSRKGTHESSSSLQQGLYQLIGSSKYLGATQELLHEFCSLGTNLNQTDRPTKQKNKQLENDSSNAAGSSSSSSRQLQSLYALDIMELHKRKRKLLAMLEELDRRYRHYCEQMKAAVSSFEAVAGNGAATVYSAMASKAMSRHFRSLRDGIVGQIKATNKAMGDMDTVAPRTTKGETPRLRILEQTLRQQRAVQPMTMMESHPWRPQRGLPERAVSVLRAWLFEHFLHPYPSDVDKHILAGQTGLTRSQVSNWFINARVRLWKPMVEDMYLEETEEEMNKTGNSSSDPPRSGSNDNIITRANNRNPQGQQDDHHKLLRTSSHELIIETLKDNKMIIINSLEPTPIASLPS